MKHSIQYLLVILLILSACGKATESGNSENDEENTEDPNVALYDQVMDIHDEVMPKMDDLYKLKGQLQEKIANSPDLVAEKKQQIESIILKLDGASKSMMDWMHEFDPLPDTADEEDARAYLEDQMEKVKKVKEEMISAIEEAKKEVGEQN